MIFTFSCLLKTIGEDIIHCSKIMPPYQGALEYPKAVPPSCSTTIIFQIFPNTENTLVLVEQIME